MIGHHFQQDDLDLVADRYCLGRPALDDKASAFK